MAPDRIPGDFGRKLREARERRGISLRQIAAATKISMSVLEALERNDISRLPGGIFGRAFVRSYAIEVGLDPEAIIQDFVAQFPHDSVAASYPADQTEDNVALESDRRMAGTFLSLLAISVPVAGLVLYFGTAGRPAARVAPAAGAVEAAAPESKPPDTPPAPVFETPSASVPPPAASGRSAAPAASPT